MRIKGDYYFVAVILCFVVFFYFRQNTVGEINEFGIEGSAKVVELKRFHLGGYSLIYEYSHNGVLYTNRKSIGSYNKAKKYLNKTYKVKIHNEDLTQSIIELDKEIKTK